jgi:tetratricopeptide (TPR) repeat protein
MGPLLKALGLTIWGLVALGLLAVFILVGYEAAVKLRNVDTTVADTSGKNAPSHGDPDDQRLPQNPPQLNTGALSSTLADRFVKIGEIYYGFGDYQPAITAIQRGLDIGGVSHLDEAYVYLGLADFKLGHTEQGCKALNSLQDVPGVSPRVLKLWKLFADMHC